MPEVVDDGRLGGGVEDLVAVVEVVQPGLVVLEAIVKFVEMSGAHARLRGDERTLTYHSSSTSRFQCRFGIAFPTRPGRAV